jgi:hypothetical protein
MDINWDSLGSLGTNSGNLAGLDVDAKRSVPTAVLAKFTRDGKVNTRSLGKAVKRATNGEAVIRKIDDVVYFIPKLPDATAPAESEEDE